MSKVYTNTASLGISLQEEVEDVALVEINCAGNSYGTAATLPFSFASAGTIRKVIVIAHWVSASAFALALPTGLSLPLNAEIEIYTDAPSGDSIKVFLGGSDQFTDGTVSHTIDNIHGIKVRPFTLAAGTVWGLLT